MTSKGPLRKVVQAIDDGSCGMYGYDKYELECGHTVWATKRTARARCWKCKKEQEERKDGIS